jgi:hypothetical protein
MKVPIRVLTNGSGSHSDRQRRKRMPRTVSEPFPKHPKAGRIGPLWRDDEGRIVQIVPILIDRKMGRAVNAGFTPNGRLVALVLDLSNNTWETALIGETDLFVDEELNVSWRPDGEE